MSFSHATLVGSPHGSGILFALPCLENVPRRPRNRPQILLKTLLNVAGAPLDNNLCERALKKAIVHRKNSLFYKTLNGAKVGDLYMSLIFTCGLNDVNPFEYLTELLRHKDELAEAPERWLPWNYRENLTHPPRAGPFTESIELTSV
jgi:hypothetical protein